MSKQRFAHLSKHAGMRAEQRCNLPEERLLAMLDDGIFVHVGQKPGMPRRHLLFYSPPDEQCFVAIQDERTGTLVTILPLDFHANLAWPVTADQCDEAKLKLSLWTPRRRGNTLPSVFSIRAKVTDPAGFRKWKSLFSWPAEPYGGLARRLLACPRFQSALDDAPRQRSVDPAHVQQILVFLGAKSSTPLALMDFVERSLICYEANRTFATPPARAKSECRVASHESRAMPRSEVGDGRFNRCLSPRDSRVVE